MHSIVFNLDTKESIMNCFFFILFLNYTLFKLISGVLYKRSNYITQIEYNTTCTNDNKYSVSTALNSKFIKKTIGTMQYTS